MNVVVIIPTYNEAENLKRLIPVLAEEFKKIPAHNLYALIVDGNSPDGTSDLVKEFQKQYQFLKLYTETKKAGLGAAYIVGFKHAMAQLNADVIIEMDADFQHDPKDLVRLMQEIDAGYDYVIGSRFVKGGSIPQSWSIKRKLFSTLGSIFSKVVLWVFDINDFTSGFKASRVHGFVDKLNLDAILTKGFAYKIELLYRMHKLGAKVKEIPIAFGLRDRGDSKMERDNLMDSMRVVLTIRFLENKSFFMFIIVGFIGLGVDLLLFNVFRISILPSRFASALSGFIAMFVTYFFNNTWSFNDRKIRSGSQTIRSLVIYCLSSYVPIFVRSLLVSIATHRFTDVWYVANGAFLLGLIFGLAWNFTVYSKIVWRKKNG